MMDGQMALTASIFLQLCVLKILTELAHILVVQPLDMTTAPVNAYQPKQRLLLLTVDGSAKAMQIMKCKQDCSPFNIVNMMRKVNGI